MNRKPTGTDPRLSRRAELLPIEKDVPMPERKHLRRNVIKNTLLALKPGESFVVRGKSVSTVYARAKDLGINVLIAEFPDKSAARVWRVT